MRLVCLPAGVGATLCGSGSGSMVRVGCVSQQARALWSAPPCTHVVPRGRCIANRDRAQAAACRVPRVFRASHRASPALQPFGWSWRGAATASESEKTHVRQPPLSDPEPVGGVSAATAKREEIC